MHVRQTWTKRRKMKEGRKTGYILETKDIPIRKQKRLGTKKGGGGRCEETGPGSPTSGLLSAAQPHTPSQGTYSLQ